MPSTSEWARRSKLPNRTEPGDAMVRDFRHAGNPRVLQVARYPAFARVAEPQILYMFTNGELLFAAFKSRLQLRATGRTIKCGEHMSSPRRFSSTQLSRCGDREAGRESHDLILDSRTADPRLVQTRISSAHLSGGTACHRRPTILEKRIERIRHIANSDHFNAIVVIKPRKIPVRNHTTLEAHRIGFANTH